MGVPPSDGASRRKDDTHGRETNGSVAGRSSIFSCGEYHRDAPLHHCTIGRREIFEWLRESLDLSIVDMKQTFNGAVACQMLDRIHPGVLPIKKVDFNTKQPYSFEQNWRMLQQAFAELGIDYYLDVHQCVGRGRITAIQQIFRLLKVRYEVWEELGSLPVYNAVRVRALSKTGDMKLSYGGTPSDLRYKANRGSNGGCLDEPEDMVICRRKPPQEDIQPEVVVAPRTTTVSSVTTTVGSVQSAPSNLKPARTGRDQQEKRSLWSIILKKVTKKQTAVAFAGI